MKTNTIYIMRANDVFVGLCQDASTGKTFATAVSQFAVEKNKLRSKAKIEDNIARRLNQSINKVARPGKTSRVRRSIEWLDLIDIITANGNKTTPQQQLALDEKPAPKANKNDQLFMLYKNDNGDWGVKKLGENIFVCTADEVKTKLLEKTLNN